MELFLFVCAIAGLVASAITIADFLNIIISEHIHRVWVVDGSSLQGVITIGDFLSWIYTFNQ